MLDQTARETATRALDDLNDALAREDAAGAAGLFEPGGYWRDIVAFTWNIRTLEGRDEIAAMLADQLATVRPEGFRMAPGEPVEAKDGLLETWIEFETAAGRGRGHMRLRDGRIWTLLTAMHELKGFEEHRGPTRPRGVAHVADPGRKTWAEHRAEEAASLGHTTQPEVVIIGGGQGGIALAARLRQLDVPTIVVEKNARAGDSWRNRYKSLCLHDPVWYDHLPYLPFPDTWPVFSPKDKIGDWLEMYARVMEINYWTSTSAKRPSGIPPARNGRFICAATARRSRAPAETTRPRYRNVGKGECPDLPRTGCVPGRAAPFLPASRPRRLGGQAGRGDRLEQFRPRHRGRTLGGRRGGDDGPAVADHRGALGDADGAGDLSALFRGGRGRRHHHRQGRHDPVVTALRHLSRCSRSRSRTRSAPRMRLSTTPSRVPGSCSTGAMTRPGWR